MREIPLLYEGDTFIETTCFIGGRGSKIYFTLNITNIDSWGAKGTFHGLLEGSGGDEFIEATDGEFSAPYN